MSFLAIDLGTSFIKGAVLDLDTPDIKHSQRIPFPPALKNQPARFYEVDPQEVVTVVGNFIKTLLAQAPQCRGLVMCTQMHGMVLCTEQGQARSNMITWQDERVLNPHPAPSNKTEQSYFEIIDSRLSDDEKAQLGKELKPSLPLGYLFHMAENGQLPAERLIPASIPDFILANLSQSRPSIELTNAASHGAWNLQTQSWHSAVIDKLGLSHLSWPEIQPLNQAAYQLNINGHTLPCYPAIGDHQCAMVGAFLQAGDLSLNVATASQVTMLTETLTLGNYQTRPFFDGRFLNTIARIPAGRSLDVLLALLTELARAQGSPLDDPWPYIIDQVEAVDQPSLAVNLAFFATTVGSQGGITQIQEDNLTVGQLFRAAFESMADNYVSCAQRLDSAQSWTKLVYSGGLLQKVAPLRRIIAQKFQRDWRLCATQEDTLLGLLAIALLADGQVGSVAEAVAVLERET